MTRVSILLLAFLFSCLGAPISSSAEEEAAVSETPSVTAVVAETPQPETTLTPVIVVHGVLKMKDVYQAGIRAFKEKDFEKAERYLSRAIEMKDPYTAKYYYAEANAMLGLIYQKYLQIPEHRNLARQHYLEALRLDPTTDTARRYLPEVSGDKPD